MNSLFILNTCGNPFHDQIENSFDKLHELCPLLEIIDNVSLEY